MVPELFQNSHSPEIVMVMVVIGVHRNGGSRCGCGAALVVILDIVAVAKISTVYFQCIIRVQLSTCAYTYRNLNN